MKEAPIILIQKFQDKGLPFKIHTLRGLMQEGDDTYALPHSNDYYEMIWVTNGSGVLKADLKEIVLKMMNEFDHQYSLRTQLLKKYFKIFLIYLSRQFEENLQVVKQTR